MENNIELEEKMEEKEEINTLNIEEDNDSDDYVTYSISKETKIKPKYKEQVKAVKDDFRNFLYIVFKAIELPEPTPLQYDIANTLQGNEKRLIIEAFRGCGKSYITAAFVIWCLMKDPQLNILVVSASKSKSDDNTQFIKKVIHKIPFLSHLKSAKGQRDKANEFDVGPAKASQSASVRSMGINSQLAGGRADIILADDVEGTNNSQTELKRERLLKLCEEFESIIKPEGNTKIIFLGTPQTEATIYNKLSKKGYRLFIWPALKPIDETKYNSKIYPFECNLAPYVRDLKIAPGEPVDPKRFNKQYLDEKLLSISRSTFQLQFMLDVSLSDFDKFPLKTQDFIVYNFPITKAPMDITHSSQRYVFENYGVDGDYFVVPSYVDTEFKPFEDIVMGIDTAGRGKDETAYSIVGIANGKLYILDVGGFLKPTADENTLQQLYIKAKEYNVRNVVVESNFGPNMEIIQSYFRTNGLYSNFIPIFNTKQKETRIIETLSPIMLRHKLIIREELLKKERDFINGFTKTKINFDDMENVGDGEGDGVYEEEHRKQYSLIYQIAYLSNMKGCLLHDDRIDSLALACSYFKEKLDLNETAFKNNYLENKKKEYLDKFVKDFNKNLNINTREKGVRGIKRGIL